MTMSTIIFLLGIGSSGKSTISNELMKLDKTFHVAGFDYAVFDLDKKYWPGGSHDHDGFFIEKAMTPDGEVSDLKSGPVGKNFLKKMLADMIHMADEGKNLIIDTVPSDEEYQQLLAAFSKHKVIHVGLKPPIQVVIDRENMRTDRRPGTAKAEYEKFYANKVFDIEIDTSKVPSHEAAQLVIECISAKNKLRK